MKAHHGAHEDLVEFGVVASMLEYLESEEYLLSLAHTISPDTVEITPQEAKVLLSDAGIEATHVCCPPGGVPPVYQTAALAGHPVLLWLRSAVPFRFREWWDLDMCEDHGPRVIKWTARGVLSIPLVEAVPLWTGHLLIISDTMSNAYHYDRELQPHPN